MERSQGILRRSLLIAGAAGAIAPSFGSAQPSVLTKPIPSTGEALPLIGLQQPPADGALGSAEGLGYPLIRLGRFRIVLMAGWSS